MLIPSHRHTPADLRLWAELEDADRAHAAAASMRDKVARSLDAVRSFLAVGPAYCSVSWGKDSVVALHLAIQVRADLPVRNIRVEGSRNPYCDAVRDAFLARYPCDYAEIPCSYAHVSRAVVGETYDRETNKIWNAAIASMQASAGTDRHISGVRAQESTVRRLRCARWGFSTDRTCAPLAWWHDKDVFAYLAKHDLPVHPNYAMLGGGRWTRERLRVAEIGDSHGRGGGRAEWEREYYGDVLNRIECASAG